MDAPPLDVLVIGGGPAGLSAALVLGRCRRKVVVGDAGAPRNAAARAVHGVLTREGIAPSELRALGRAEVERVGVAVRDARVEDVRRTPEGFEGALANGERLRARTLLLATGARDTLPKVPGFDALYGESAHHCPICDGWEHRDQPLVAYARGAQAAEYALGLRGFGDDVVLCTDGADPPGPGDLRRLARAGIAVRTERIARLEGERGRLTWVVFEPGEALARAAFFFHLGLEAASELALRIGCTVDAHGSIATQGSEARGAPGVYVAGDVSVDLELVAVAMAEGVRAAHAIHLALRREDIP